MKPEIEQALLLLQQVVNAAISKGVFTDSTGVVNTHNALVLLGQALSEGKQ